MAKASAPTVTISIAGITLILGLIGGLFWLSDWSEEREANLARPVLSSTSLKDREALKECLQRNIVLTGKPLWKDANDARNSQRANNSARHLTIEITDSGTSRRVTMSTRNAMPLRAADKRSLHLCL